MALVTGAGRGIGRGVALALGRVGASVAAVDLDGEAAQRTALEVEAIGSDALAVTCDVRDEARCRAAVDATLARFGGVDVLVNCAQQMRVGVPFAEQTDDDMALAWESGPLATARLMRYCHPVMRERGGGCVVNMGSGAGTEGFPGMASYAAAKEAIRALTKVAAREWGRDGIRVNTICPYADSPALREHLEREPGAVERRLRQVPLGRFGDAERDVGEVVAFLASDAGSYITAQTLMVDGGACGFR